MREIAGVAIAQGIRQQRLAKMLNPEQQAANVRRHFEAARPRKSTVEDYRRILGMTRQHVRLITGFVSKSDRQSARDSLRANLRFRDHLFDEGAIAALNAFFSSENSHAALDAYLLARSRDEHGLEDSADAAGDARLQDLPSYVRAFAAAARSVGFDLAAHVKPRAVSHIHGLVEDTSELVAGNPEHAATLVNGVLKSLGRLQPAAASLARLHLERCRDCRHTLGLPSDYPISDLYDAEQRAAHAAETEDQS